MKISIIGVSGGFVEALIYANQHNISFFDSINDITPDNTDILICDDSVVSKANDIVLKPEILVTCGHPLANIGKAVFPQEISIPDRDNSFRGGSRGKGGKTKYRRGV